LTLEFAVLIPEDEKERAMRRDDPPLLGMFLARSKATCTCLVVFGYRVDPVHAVSCLLRHHIDAAMMTQFLPCQHANDVHQACFVSKAQAEATDVPEQTALAVSPASLFGSLQASDVGMWHKQRILGSAFLHEATAAARARATMSTLRMPQ
jgi:hypothetical protein